MRLLPKLTLLVLLLGFTRADDPPATNATAVETNDVNKEATKEEPLLGQNFCNTGEFSCFCDTGLKPVQIICESMELKNIYEEADWIATFKYLNITAEEPMDISFASNDIEDIPRLPKMNVIMLSFHRNKIRSISRAAFAELEQLDTLNLAENELDADSLAEQVFFGKAENNNSEIGYFTLPIKHLNLSRNYIHSIDSAAFDHLNSLISLDLRYNPLRVLSSTARAIGELRKLEFLGLSNTSINSLPEGMLHDLKYLTALDLSFNLFTKVPPELSFTHKLVYLSLDGNLLEILDKDSFTNLDSLQDLSIRSINTLRRIDNGTFAQQKKLEKLDLSFNRRLEEIDDDAFLGLIDKENPENWPIKEIRLNDNGLSHIDAGLLPWTQVDYVDIQNNPFRCDCNLEWMIKVLVERIRLSNPLLAVDLTCAEPQEMKGKSIKSLSEESERFSKCSGSNSLYNEDYAASQDPFKAAGVTVLIIGIMLIIIGVGILGFIVLKRRAITQALTSPSTIRYERAGTEEGADFEQATGRKYNLPSSIYK